MTTRSWRHYITRPLSLGLVVGLCSLGAAGGAAAATWTPSQVDNSADVGRFPSLAADGSAKLHVSYLDATGTLKYASNKSGSWSTEAVGNVAAGTVTLASTALALAGANPQINYYTASDRGVRNIVFNGSSWGLPTNPNQIFTPLPDQSTALFHRGGVSYMVFVKKNGNNEAFSYTRNTTPGDYSIWSPLTTLDQSNSPGSNNSIVVDSLGTVHVVGYSAATSDLIYYNNASGSFTSSDPVSNTGAVGKYCNLAVDASDNLHLVYLETTASPASYRIKYQFKPAGGAWQGPQDIADAGALGGHLSIKTDSAGTPHISYYHSTAAGSGLLRYATNLTGAWTIDDVDTGSADLGKYSSIAVAGSTVAIAYYDVTNSAIKVATAQIISGARISLTPASLDFGSVNRGSSWSQSFTINNVGSTALGISSISLTGASAAQFSAGSCSLLLPGADCTVSVTLTPNGGGVKSAEVAIASNDPTTPIAQVALSGSSPWWISTQVGHGGSGGTISPAGQINVDPGQSQSFTIAPLGAPFSLTDLLVDSVSVGAVGSYTFNNVSADHSMEALFVSPIRLVGIPFIYYASLQQAYDAMVESGTMQTLTSVPGAEALLVDQPVDATIKGGYETGFSSQTGSTLLSSITISNGNLTPDGLVLQ